MLLLVCLKNHNNSKYFYYAQSDKIEIHSSNNFTWTLDGEYGGRKKDIVITNNKEAIEYIIPVLY